MYTRFKSSKNGLKLGLNTITNNARSKVAVSNNTSPTGVKSIQQQQNGKENKENLNIIPTKSTTPPTTTTTTNSNIAFINHVLNGVPLFDNSFVNMFDENDSTPDTIDENCVKYIKTTWEKYSRDVGKPDGPVKYVDTNANHEHLKDFVAFDMERWWAERSLNL